MQKTIAKIVLASMILSASPLNLFADSIDATENKAWGENTGWINMSPTNGNVDVSTTAITGHAWGENTGWINMAPTNGGVTNTCGGVLGGYAWSQSMGWINFTGVTIDANGYFAGTATDDQSGSIAFTGTNIAVKTDWRPDCVAPGIPVVSSISTDTGSSATDYITSDNTLEITGTAEANSVVEVFINGTSVGNVPVDANGDWTYDYTATVLPDNNYDVTVMGIDANGNASVQSNIIDVEVDTTAPAAVTINEPIDNSVTSDTTPTVAGTGEPGSTVDVTIAGGFACTATVDPSGVWSCDIAPALTDGNYVVDVVQTDVAGNVSPVESVNLEIDTTAPAAPTVDVQLTNDNTPTVTGTVALATGETLSVEVNGVVYTEGDGNLSVSGGVWTLVVPTVLSDGQYEVLATVTDAAGNTTPDISIAELEIDATAPLAPVITSHSDGDSTSDTTPTLTGTGEPGALVTVDDGNGHTCTDTVDASGNWSCNISPAHTDGDTPTYVVSQADDAGNVSPTDSVDIIIDTTAPTAPTVDNQLSNSTTPTLTGMASLQTGEDLSVEVNGVTYTLGDGNLTVAGSVWTLNIPTGNELVDGTYDVTATIVDAAGNLTTDTSTDEITIDATAPVMPTLNGPTNGSPVTGTAEAGTTVVVTTPSGATCTTTADATGNYTCVLNPTPVDGEDATVVSTDDAGNASTHTEVAAIDIMAPTTPTMTAPTTGNPIVGNAEPGVTVIVTTPSGATCTTTADASGNFVCSLSPTPVDGEDASILTIDDAGNTSTALYPAAIDLSAPTTTTVDTPTNGSPVVGTAEPGSTVNITTPSGATCTATATASGTYSCELLPTPIDGEDVIVTTTDAAGNVDSFIVTAGIDIEPPVTPTLDGPTNGNPVVGTAEPLTTIVVTTPSGATCTTTADANGDYSCALSPTPVDGEDATVVSTDAAGNSTSHTEVDAIDVDAPSAITLVAPTTGGPVVGTAEPLATVVITTPSGATCTTTTDATGNYSCTLSPTPVDGEDATVMVTDAAGNNSSTTFPEAIDLSTPAPTVNGPTNGDPVTGTAEPFATVVLTTPNGATCTTTADAAGNYACTLSPTPVDGEDVTATATDEAGNVNATTEVEAIDIETPSTPTVNGPTNGTNVTGTAEPGATVVLTTPSGATCTTTADAAGNYACSMSPEPLDGETLTVTATDPAGNVATAVTNVVIDNTDPEQVSIDGTSSGANITGSGEPGATIVLTTPSGATCTTVVASNGTWACTLDAEPINGEDVAAASTDPAGNVSTGVFNGIIDSNGSSSNGGSNGGGSNSGNSGGNWSGANDEGNLDNSEIDESEETELNAASEEPVEIIDTMIEEVMAIEEPAMEQTLSGNNSGMMEKTISVNGTDRAYTMKSDYETCPIIENIKDETYDDNHYSYLLDIDNYDNVDFLKRLERAGVIDGDDKQLFDGSREMTRVEFLKIMMRSHCIEYRAEDTSDLEFVDTDKSTWQAKVIKKALILNIASGDVNAQGQKIFRGNEVISRGEAIKIALNMALLQTTGEVPDNSYDDIDLEWHKRYVDQAEYLGVLNAQDEGYEFGPSNPTSRQNFTKLLENIFKLY